MLGQRLPVRTDGADLCNPDGSCARQRALLSVQVGYSNPLNTSSVEPALPSLDILARARERFDLPIGAYQVSGEHAQIAAAAERGWIDGRRTQLEALTSIVRAGASFVVTYAAADVATWLREENR